LFHLGSELGQEVLRQLSIGVGLRDVVTKLVAIEHHGWVLIRDRGLMGSNNWAVVGDVMRRCDVWVLTSVNELGESLVGLGTTGDLGLCNPVLVNWKRGSVVGKLVAGGRRH
jgi:hypothetical protein